jgi:hypothetical protein
VIAGGVEFGHHCDRTGESRVTQRREPIAQYRVVSVYEVTENVYIPTVVDGGELYTGNDDDAAATSCALRLKDSRSGVVIGDGDRGEISAERNGDQGMGIEMTVGGGRVQMEIEAHDEVLVVHVAGLDQQTDRSALFAVDRYVRERGHAREFDAGWGQETPRDRYRLDRLIESTGTDGLYLDRTLLSNYACERSRNGVGVRLGRDLEYFHGCSS